MNKRVEIFIDENNFDGTPCKYSSNDKKNNKPYTSVGFTASIYGMAFPCDTSRQIKSALEHAIDWIKREGDKPVIIDKRRKATLMNWTKGT